MAKNVKKLEILQGATFEETVQVLKKEDRSPVNLTGFAARGQIKSAIGAAVVASFTGTIVDAANGKVTFSMLPSTTAALNWSGEYLYDWEIYSGTATVYRVQQGTVTLDKEVTV